MKEKNVIFLELVSQKVFIHYNAIYSSRVILNVLNRIIPLPNAEMLVELTWIPGHADIKENLLLLIIMPDLLHPLHYWQIYSASFTRFNCGVTDSNPPAIQQLTVVFYVFYSFIFRIKFRPLIRKNRYIRLNINIYYSAILFLTRYLLKHYGLTRKINLK